MPFDWAAIVLKLKIINESKILVYKSRLENTCADERVHAHTHAQIRGES